VSLPPDEQSRRPRGRPRRDVTLEALLDAVDQLFQTGGAGAVTVGAVADRVGVSRATLYKSVHSGENLLGMLFERETAELTGRAMAICDRRLPPREELGALVRLQIGTAVRLRRQMFAFAQGDVPEDLVERWRRWGRDYEQLWCDSIARAIEAGAVSASNPRLSARLVLGLCVQVAWWFREDEDATVDDVVATANALLGWTEN
jgi:AcrR family transcriptional regulator